MPARSSPSPSRISAMSAPMTRTSRRSNLAARRARAASSCTPTHRRRRTTAPTRHLDDWLRARGVIGLSGIDTRALTALIREKGMPNAVIAHAPDGVFDLDALKAEARDWPGLVGMDLVPMVTSGQRSAGTRRPGSGARATAARPSRIPCRRHRLRREAQHPAAPGRRRLQGHGGAGEDLGRGYSGAQARRRVPLQRPGRSGGDRRICRAGDPRA